MPRASTKMTAYAKTAFSALALSFIITMVTSQDVDQKCIGCICEAISGCDTSDKCDGDKCGPYKITPAYWADAGKPTVKEESPNAATAFANCASDKSCSGTAVKGYMSKHRKDCDGDGMIDCEDFVLIHVFGGNECKDMALPEPVKSRYEKCQKA